MNPQYGAAAVAAGGYGCVFNPALLCEGETIRRHGKVSKLMLKEYAEREIKELQTYQYIISSIPNYEEYFIIGGITICKPRPLNEKIDLKKFDAICNNLTEKKYNSSNVNNYLNELRAITLTNGGIDIKKYLKKNLTSERFNVLNGGLIKLLKYGIVPMNKKKLYHFDLKAGNILISDDNKVRIIDWGLSAIQIGNEIPQNIKNRPYQFNLPIGTLVLQDEFKTFLKDELVNLKSKAKSEDINTRDNIRFIATKWFHEFQKINGSGHKNYILESLNFIYEDELSFMKKMSSKDLLNFIYYNILINFITETITSIILKYTNFSTMDFDAEEYFNEVYCHNVDICGFLMTYNNIFFKNSLYKKTIIFSKEEKENFFFILKHIFYKYLFSDEYACKKINIDELIEELKKLSKTLGTNIIINSHPLNLPEKILKTKKNKIIKLKLTKKDDNIHSLPVNKYTLSKSSTNSSTNSSTKKNKTHSDLTRSKDKIDLIGKNCKRKYCIIKKTRRCKKNKK